MNSSLSQVAGFEKLQTAWDSTSLGLLKECPAKYNMTILQGYQSRGSNVHLHFGLCYHSALEHYDKRRATGEGHEAALADTVRHTLTISRTPLHKHDCGCGNSLSIATRLEACNICGRTDITVTNVTQAWDSYDKYKNLMNLVRTVVWYLDHFDQHPLETVILANGKPAVELSFKMETPWTAPDGAQYLMCGHLDKLAKMGDQTYIVDRKTTKSQLGSDYFNKYSPDNQMSLYTIAGRTVFGYNMTGVIIDGAQIGVNFSRFERGFTTRTPDHTDEWLKDAYIYIKQNEAYVAADHWPMNDKACGNFGGCTFADVCRKAPGVRKQFLETGFDKRIWDPLKNRE